MTVTAVLKDPEHLTMTLDAEPRTVSGSSGRTRASSSAGGAHRNTPPR